MFGLRPVIINIEKVILLPPQLSPTAEELLGELLEKVNQLMSTSEDLAREVQETRDAFVAVTERVQAQTATMQQHIDELQAALDAGDTTAARDAVAALDALQTEMSNTAQPPAPPVEPPVEEPPAE